MSSIFVFALLVAGVFAATTKHPHNHHTHGHHNGHITGETFKFDAHSNNFLILSGHTCYLFKLTSDHVTSLQTQSGLHALEKTVVDLIDQGGGTTLTKDAVQSLPQTVTHFCHHHNVYKTLN